ncbi:MAG: sulfotransferase [Rhodopirellula sp.]|nr:sulfotransferase [Rhodopirellula sp.]
MDPAAAPSVKADIGGYKDRFWIPRFWSGITTVGWFRLMAHNRFRVSPIRMAMALILLLLSLFNSVLWAIQQVFLGRRIRATKIEQDPIFIVGHWRSGTTLLHELMVLDPRHSYPDTYSCFAPNHFPISRRVLPPLLTMLIPTRRPMDNMPAGWDRPQEDEFALCNMGLPSPYLTQAFPNEPPQYPEYLDFDGVAVRDLQRWKDTFVWFLKCLTFMHPKRIVLKSPPHTARIRALLEIFPRAKFVHIFRDPYVVFPSTVNLWKRLYRDQGLQTPKYEGLEEVVLEALNRMYAAFERDRELLGPNQLAEVSYESLVADPVGEVRRIYSELELGDFEVVLPALEEFVSSQKDYKRNRYEIAPETRAAIDRRWGRFIEKYGYAEAGSRQ